MFLRLRQRVVRSAALGFSEFLFSLLKDDRVPAMEAIRLSEEEGRSVVEVERRLGIGQGGISHWKRQLGLKGDCAFPGKGQQRGLEETVRQLQRECERLRRERDILKKSGQVVLLTNLCLQGLRSIATWGVQLL